MAIPFALIAFGEQHVSSSLTAILIASAPLMVSLPAIRLAPVVAVALGVTLLGEGLGAGAVAGLLLILAGSWLATGRRLPPGLGSALRAFGRRPGTPPGEVGEAGIDPAVG